MRAFVFRLCLFWLPVLIPLAVLEAALFAHGETLPMREVHAQQEAHPDRVFMRGVFSQDFAAYKLEGILRRRPRVLILGSSRVMMLRSEMFGERDGFYNAGGAVTHGEDTLALVRTLPADYRPEVVLLGVDLWWLNPSFSNPALFASASRSDSATSWEAHVTTLRSLLTEPQKLRKLMAWPHPRWIGTNRVYAFRADGSVYSDPKPEPGWRFVDRESPPILERVRAGIMQFAPADRVDPIDLHSMQEAIATLRRRGTLVVGYLPPFSTEVARELRVSPRHRPLWAKLRAAAEDLFTDAGMPFFDASEPARLGLDDRYLWDGFHPNETFNVHLIRKLLDDPRMEKALPRARTVVERAIRSPRTDPWRPDLESSDRADIGPLEGASSAL